MNTQNRTPIPLIPILALLWAGTAHASSYVSIVKVYGYDGEVDQIPMTIEEMNALRAEITEEARYHMPALMLAKQNWKAAGEDGTYPKTAVKRRRFIKTNRFKSHREAEEYLDRRAASKKAFQEKKEERRKWEKAKSNSGWSSSKGSGGIGTGGWSSSKSYKSSSSSSKRSKERDKKREAAKAERAEERLARKDRAVDYYLDAIQEVRIKEQERMRKLEEEKALVQEQLKRLR